MFQEVFSGKNLLFVIYFFDIFCIFMPRAAVVGNGSLTVTIDKNAQVREIFFPHVGLENHTGHMCPSRIGFFSEGNFSWTSEKNWKISQEYTEESMVVKNTIINKKMEIEVKIKDCVHTHDDIFFRKIYIKNTSGRKKEIRSFFHFDFHIYGDKQKDTAQYEPTLEGVLHYRQKRYFFVGGQWEKTKQKIESFSCGKSGIQGKEGTFRDAEDGKLSENPIEQGSVDFVVEAQETFAANEEKVFFLWMCAGKKYHDIRAFQEKIKKETPEKMYKHTKLFWKNWAEKKYKKVKNMPIKIQKIFLSSLFVLRTHADWNGGIIAALDNDIMKTNRDNYNYIWMRDGSICSMTLMALGERNIPEKFFSFCAKVLHEKGYFLHKYNADESVGSSWLPWWKNGNIQLPIQQDESSFVLLALYRHFETFECLDTLQHFWKLLIQPLGNFISEYVDTKTGLPKPSYDMWEQDFSIQSSTVACNISALHAAEKIAEKTGHQKTANTYKKAKKKMQRAFERYCIHQEKKCFLRVANEKKCEADSAMYFLWKSGTVDISDEYWKKTAHFLAKKLRIKNIPFAMARKENDSYHFEYSHMSHREITGNPWVLSTLWHAEYLIAKAATKKELDQALAILMEVSSWADGAGMLPEQIHPYSKKTLFISPLAWSHSAFLDTILAYIEKEKIL